MQAIGRHLAPAASTIKSSRNNPAFLSPVNSPRLQSYTHKPCNAVWPTMQRATYYIDAAQQTGKTLRTLIHHNETSYNSLGTLPNFQLLSDSMQRLLFSIKPGIINETASKEHYLALLRMHLSSLTENECAQLQKNLKSARFACTVMESVIDDVFYLEYGFSNGSPRQHDHLLFHTQMLFDLFDEIQKSSVITLPNTCLMTALPPETKQELRNILAQAAKHWPETDQSLPDLLDIACRIGAALEIPSLPTNICATEFNLYGTTIRIKNAHLVIDLSAGLGLRCKNNDALLGRVLRDLLEAFLIYKFTGKPGKLCDLSIQHRQFVCLAIEQISETCTPAVTDHSLRLKARAVWSRTQEYGQIQIKPSVGAFSGHAWITPSLSLVPDTSINATVIGKQFMRTGLHLHAQETPVRAWPAKFLTEAENDRLHPADSAWHLTVPVTTSKLQRAAFDVIADLKVNPVPYRFTNTEVNTSGTSSKLSVWQAVRNGLEPDALALFRHYNQGLPDPDSPTELWIRLHGLMKWIKHMAGAH